MVNLGFWIGFVLKTAKMKLSLHDLLIVKATAPNYFNGLSWYKENKEFSEDDLSDIERHNLEIIKSHLEEF